MGVEGNDAADRAQKQQKQQTKGNSQMNIEEMKRVAHENAHECIVARDGYICIRPMIFDCDGVRQVMYKPDPCEFERPDTAEARIRALMLSRKGQ